MVTCPNCSSSIPVSDEGIVIQELPIHKRKSLQIQGEKPKIIKVPIRIFGKKIFNLYAFLLILETKKFPRNGSLR
jgi:hypothetical protein